MKADIMRRLRDMFAQLDVPLSQLADYSTFLTMQSDLASVSNGLSCRVIGAGDTGFRAWARVYGAAGGSTYSVWKTSFFVPVGGSVMVFGTRIRMTNNQNRTSTLTPKWRVDGGAWNSFTGGAQSMAAFATVRSSATVANIGTSLSEGWHTFELGIASSATAGASEWIGFGELVGGFFESPDNGAADGTSRWGQ